MSPFGPILKPCAICNGYGVHDLYCENNPHRPPRPTPAETFAAMLECARSWAPAACLMGNVRADDIVAALESLRLDIPAPADDDALPPEILP